MIIMCLVNKFNGSLLSEQYYRGSGCTQVWVIRFTYFWQFDCQIHKKYIPYGTKFLREFNFANGQFFVFCGN